MKKILLGLQFIILLLLVGRSNIFASEYNVSIKYDDLYKVDEKYVITEIKTLFIESIKSKMDKLQQKKIQM